MSVCLLVLPKVLPSVWTDRERLAAAALPSICRERLARPTALLRDHSLRLYLVSWPHWVRLPLVHRSGRLHSVRWGCWRLPHPHRHL